MIYKINNIEEMMELSKKIFDNLNPKDIVCLHGDLGSGKTTLVQMLAKHAKIKEIVTSPTFEIAKIYYGPDYQFTHLDAYRLEGRSDLEMFDEYIYNDGLTFIEWSEFLNINQKTKNISIKVIQENIREVKLDGFNF